jgi:hypothetical protein
MVKNNQLVFLLGVPLRVGLSPLAFPLKKREELRQWLNPSRKPL